MVFSKSNKAMEYVEKALLHGALTGAGTYLLFGNVTANTPLGTYPLYLLSSGVGVTTSATNDIIHKYVFKEIPINKKVRHDVSLILSAIISGFMYNQSLSLLNEHLPREYGYMQGFAVGSGAEVASGFILDLIR